uniref:DUF4220 domain-containing protein n=1 Tax=Ananas comosus var. bracteatus TaxID=296719 RepID=A0A6V7PQ12_ANACO|nr:unnamed protein product [Ananas comosus var. bracteatus]
MGPVWPSKCSSSSSRRSAAPPPPAAPASSSWSGYLLADWVADLALGLLLNALGNIGPSSTATVTISHASPKPDVGGSSGSSGGSSSSPVIFALWAPFLLLHLGGPDTITAFSVEDNELWPSHLIGLLFELFAASTVFLCPLRGNPFVLATVFMLVIGVVKYAERTYSLYRGSADGLRKSMLGDPDPGPNYAKMMEEYDAKIKAGLPADIDVQKAPASAEPKIAESSTKRIPSSPTPSGSTKRSTKEAFQVIEVELGFVYDIVYTKATVVHRRLGYALRPIGSACIAAAFLAFFFADKRGFTRVDVAITYALLAGAAVLDFAALVMLLCWDWARVFFADKRLFNKCCACIKNLRFWRRRRRRRWSEKGFADEPHRLLPRRAGRGRGAEVGREWPVSRLADKVGVKEVLDETLYVRREEVTAKMKEFIFDKMKEAAREADGYEKIKEVCERRGAGALKKLELMNDREIMKTVEVDFDQSLLLWHIATELCHYQDNSTTQGTQRRISVTLSEYLVYLLVKQPAMLSTAAGIGLLRFRDTCAEARRFFAMGGRQLTPEQARRHLVGVNTSVPPADVKGDRSKSVLFDACILSKKLGAMGERKWEARAHALQLSRGGELATAVWLLMAHVGLGKLYQIQAGDARATLIVDK